MNPKSKISNGHRKVLNNERKFLFTPMANISLVARLNGRIDEENVRQAISKVRIIHPQSAVRVVTDSNHNAWFYTDNVPEIPLRVVDREHDSQWFDEVWQEQQTPFNPFTGPLLRFVLLKSSKVSDLVVFAQHAICDGTGLAYLLRDVLIHLGNPELEVKPIPVPPLLTPENLPGEVKEKAIVKLLRKLYSQQLNKKWQRNPFFFDIEDFHAIQNAFLRKYTYRVITAELSTTETEKLVTICREQNVSVNSGLTSALIAAYNDVIGPLQGSKRKVAELPHALLSGR